MPKKAPKNAFYFFMKDFQEEQRKSGIHYNNLKEVADAADPEWKNAHLSVKKKFQDIAKNYKMKMNGSDQKLTCTGQRISDLVRLNREREDAIEFERQDITNIVRTKSLNNTILDDDFYVMDVNSLCCVRSDYFIGEFTIMKFNVRDGIKDNYHEVINPGYTPLGYSSETKEGCNMFGLDFPDEDQPTSNYMQILANIIDYLKQHSGNSKSLPPFYTMPEKVKEVQSFILDLCNRASEDDTLFQIYRLDTLFYTLINAITEDPTEGLPQRSLAKLLLEKDDFNFSPGLECEHHAAGEKGNQCTMSRAKRWIFIILDRCCPVVGVDAVAGKHVPSEFDVERILACVREKRARAGPLAVSVEDGRSSSRNDSLNDSSISCRSNETTKSRRTKRTYVPLRMPQSNRFEQVLPAPELTESDFPALSSNRGRGRGRGGMCASFSNLRVDE